MMQTKQLLDYATWLYCPFQERISLLLPLHWWTKSLAYCMQKDQGTEDKEAGQHACWQDVSRTVWCHTWINLFSGRRCVAVDPPSPSVLGVCGRQHKIRSEVGICWTHKLEGFPASKQRSGDTSFSTLGWVFHELAFLRGAGLQKCIEGFWSCKEKARAMCIVITIQ